MADFRAARGGDGSPSRCATSEQFCGDSVGKLTKFTNAIPPSPALVGKLNLHDDHCADLRASITASIGRLLILAALTATAAVLIAVETLT